MAQATNVEKGMFFIAIVAVVVSITATIFQSNQTQKQLQQTQESLTLAYESNIISSINSRISTCTSLSANYATQSWAYKSGENDGDPDENLESYAHLSIAVARALRLCTVEHSTVDAITNCIATQVDTEEHKVLDSSDEKDGPKSLIC